jgi:hypothetical protein
MREEAEAIFVTPYWPSQPWFPIIMDLAVAVPRLLRPSPDLLTTPLGESHPLVQNDSIRLIAWKLSGSALLRAEFQKTLQPSSSPQHEKIQTLHTRALGIFGEIGATREKDPLSPSPADIINFLAEYSVGRSYRTVNVARSALSSTLAVNPGNVAVGADPLVNKLLKGLYNKSPPDCQIFSNVES